MWEYMYSFAPGDTFTIVHSWYDAATRQGYAVSGWTVDPSGEVVCDTCPTLRCCCAGSLASPRTRYTLSCLRDIREGIAPFPGMSEGDAAEFLSQYGRPRIQITHAGRFPRCAA